MGARGPQKGQYGEGRTVVLPVRVSPEERAAWERAAELGGQKLGAWMRSMIAAGMAAAAPPPKVSKKKR
jgi:hypothetical protein